jgi:hypothetical protein
MEVIEFGILTSVCLYKRILENTMLKKVSARENERYSKKVELLGDSKKVDCTKIIVLYPLTE